MPKTAAEKLLFRAGAPVVVLGAQSLGGTDATPLARRAVTGPGGPSAPVADELALPGEPAPVSSPADVPTADVVVAFVADGADLERTLDLLIPEAAAVRAVWLAYRKGNVVDINRDTIAERVRARVWRPVTQVAVDDEWSALRIRPA